jgi:hypothetical protein
MQYLQWFGWIVAQSNKKDNAIKAKMVSRRASRNALSRSRSNSYQIGSTINEAFSREDKKRSHMLINYVLSIVLDERIAMD